MNDAHTFAALRERRAAAFQEIESSRISYAERAALALAEWTAMGEPVDVRALDADIREAVGEAELAERQRASRRTWATSARNDESVAKNVLMGVLSDIEREYARRADVARAAGQLGRRAARQARREVLVVDLKEMRDQLGLTDSEVDALLGLRRGEFHNSWLAQGSYALERIEATAAALSAHVKVRKSATS